jgi:hypothetical protein
MSDYPADIADLWDDGTTTRTVEAADGTTSTVVGNDINRGVFSWRNLAVANVIAQQAAATAPYDTLQHFWQDIIKAGQSFRLVPDTSSYAATTDYETALFRGKSGEPYGSFRSFCKRHVRTYNGLWDVDLPLVECTG